MAESVKNAKEFPKIFYCRHMLPGIARYENVDKETGKLEEEHLFIDTDAMKQAAPTFVGKPVYVYHQKVDLSNIHEADGYIVECFYNELDGWLWAKFLAVSDEAITAIASKWSVSNAYIPIDWVGGGTHLNVDYDRKIRNYEFTHLAIVPNPRYEEAKIFTPEEFKAYQASKRSELEELQNSNPNHKESPAMSFFRNKKEEIKAGDTITDSDFTEIKNEDGTPEIVTVGQLKEAHKAAKALEAEKLNAKKNEKMVDDDEEVEVDGEKVNMSALKECYKNMKKVKHNADEEEQKKKEEKENAEKEEKEKKEKEEKENAKRFEELQNAHKTAKPARVELSIDKQNRGAQRYGSAKK